MKEQRTKEISTPAARQFFAPTFWFGTEFHQDCAWQLTALMEVNELQESWTAPSRFSLTSGRD
jgi:hypothetical protein